MGTYQEITDYTELKRKKEEYMQNLGKKLINFLLTTEMNSKKLIRELIMAVHPDKLRLHFPFNERSHEGARFRSTFYVLASKDLFDDYGQINIEKKRKLIEMIQYIYPSFDFGSFETWEAFLEQRIDKIRDLSVELQHKKIYFLK